MTAAIERYEQPVGPLIEFSGDRSAQVERIAAWAESAHAAHEVAKTLCQTSFVPDVFRGKPMEATAAILTGAEVGLSPMAALNAFDVIQGRAAPRAITQRAVAQSRGHEIVLVESTERRCVMRGRRRGESQWQQVTWTIERAQRLKLTGKSQWQTQPQTMLVARATGEISRLVASDALLGIAYNIEELRDSDETPEPATGARKVSRRKAPAAPPRPVRAETPDTSSESAGGPPLPGEDGYEDDAPVREAKPEPVNKDQLRKLHASFTDVGIIDRDDRLAYAAQVIERDIASSNDLTRDEASRVIDALTEDAADTAGGETA